MNETVLLLPGYEPWLRRAWSPDCAKGPPDRVNIDSGVYWLIIDWLTRNVRFPI